MESREGTVAVQCTVRTDLLHKPLPLAGHLAATYRDVCGRSAVEVVGEELRVERGAHEDEAQVGAAGEEVEEHDEEEVWG